MSRAAQSTAAAVHAGQGVSCRSQTLRVLAAAGRLHALPRTFRQSAGGISFTYTARNQKKTEKDRLGNTTVFTYDPVGNLLTISDAENEAKKATVTPEVYEAGKTRYTYTERNQLLTERFPGETAARSYTYHPNGQLWTRTDQRGIVTTYGYDGANRLTNRAYSDAPADTFVLDDAGRIKTATSGRYGTVVERTWKPTGLIESETTTWPFGISGVSTSATVQYAYDAANRATTLTLPDGRTLDRTFTARNELESLTIGGQSIATLGYDNAGRRTSTLFGNGLTDARGYTDNNLLKTTVVGPAAAPLLSLEYAYDANNRKTSETDHRDASRSISLGYDDADRLTSWTTGANPKLPTSQTWDLSAVGDWKKTTVDGVVENREHTDVHEVKTRNGVAVGYDPAGNLIRTDSGQTFAWDAENRLLAADTAPNADGAKDRAVYQTDAFGRRVAKSVYGSTYLAVHDGWQVVQELSGPTTLPASAAADDGSLANLATVPAGAILPTTYDAQGNPQYPTRINFQPATTQIPSGYLADKSKDFAVRSNGLSYGWTAAEGAPSRSEPVIRHFMPLPQYDTFVPTGDPETWTWQIALPAGSYPVVLVLGDATNREHTFHVTVQGETFPDPHPYDPAENTGYEAGRFVGVAKQVTVGEDGLLTIQAAADALNATLCWLEIGVEGSQLTEELRQKLADEVIHANARTGGSPFWDGGRSETKTFVWGPGIDELMGYQRTTAETGTTTYFVHGNQQWSVYAVTDASGQVVERFQYTATGKRASDVAGANGRSLVGLTAGYTGRDLDEAIGTMNFRNREWEPDYQFLNRDPAGYIDGMSLYGGYFAPYAVDPSGMALYAFDGTWNYSDDKQTVDGGGGTNVYKIYKNGYTGTARYFGGVGNKVENNWLMQKLGGLTGLGSSSIELNALQQLDALYATDKIVDVIGFSRGAAQALDFLHLVKEYGEYNCREDIKIRFVGLFDVVGSYGIPGNDINVGKRLSLPAGKWKPAYTAHAVAMDEARSLFPVTDVVGATIQQAFRGNHSDIGGGYNKTGLSDITLAWMIEQGIKAGAPFKMIDGLHPDPAMLPHREVSWKYSYTPRTMPKGMVNPNGFKPPGMHEEWNGGDNGNNYPWVFDNDEYTRE